MENQEPNKEYPGSKVIDFFLGFVLNIVIAIVATALYSSLGNIINPFMQNLLVISAIILSQVILFLEFKKMNRTYIIVGMLSAIIIPLLLVGSCFLILTNIR